MTNIIPLFNKCKHSNLFTPIEKVFEFYKKEKILIKIIYYILYLIENDEKYRLTNYD